MKKSQGFTVVEGILILVVVAIIGALGYMAYTNFVASQNPEAQSTITDVTPDSSEPVTISSSKDLDAIVSELDSLDVESSSTNDQFSTATNKF